MLSKSDYLLFLRHPAWLWLKKYDKGKLPPVADNLQAMFDEGFEFEKYAEKLFPDGVRIEKGSYQDYLTQPARTQAALEKGSRVIFQGRFEAEDLTCICDVLKIVDGKTVDLAEIKSSTDVKKIHLYDLSFQKAVLEACGYTVRNLSVFCVNNEYIRQGKIVPDQLVKALNVTKDVCDLTAVTKEKIAAARVVLSAQKCPDLSPSLADSDGFRDWLEVYRGLVAVPEKSILELTRLNRDLYADLVTRGITRIPEIPAGVKLGKQQSWQVRAVRENKTYLNKEAIREFLSKLKFPLYFLDYETFAGVIPEFDGVRPYQQVPFQYSLHVLKAPEADPEHYGYLHTEYSHPVLPLTASLKEHVGEDGTVLVWSESFEKTRNTEMGCTNEACSVFYEQLNHRIVDLMTPFAEGWYVHPEFAGSASIKKVLPVLVPELSYKKLAIQDGGAAQRQWMATVFDGQGDFSDRDRVFRDLDEYCALDTMAMVVIYRKLSLI